MSSRTSLPLRQVVFMGELRGNLILYLLLCAVLSPISLNGPWIVYIGNGLKGRARLILQLCAHCEGHYGPWALGAHSHSRQSMPSVEHLRPLAGDAPWGLLLVERLAEQLEFSGDAVTFCHAAK